MGGPAPIGARKANLSDRVEPYMQEIALSEQVSVTAWKPKLIDVACWKP